MVDTAPGFEEQWQARATAAAAVARVTGDDTDELTARVVAGLEAAFLDGNPRRDPAQLVDPTDAAEVCATTEADHGQAVALLTAARTALGTKGTREQILGVAKSAAWWHAGRTDTPPG